MYLHSPSQALEPSMPASPPLALFRRPFASQPLLAERLDLVEEVLHPLAALRDVQPAAQLRVEHVARLHVHDFEGA